MVTVDVELWTVLGASLLIDGAVLIRATNELLSRAMTSDRSLKKMGNNASLYAKMTGIYNYLKKTQVSVTAATGVMLVRRRFIAVARNRVQDPFISAVFLEDLTACAGVGVAAAGIGLTQATG